MKTFITLDSDNETPICVSMVEQRVIHSQVLGVPVKLYLTDIVHITQQGVACSTKLRYIMFDIPEPTNIYDVESNCSHPRCRIHPALGLQGISRIKR